MVLKSATYNWPTTSDGVIEAFAEGSGLNVDTMLDYPDVTLDWYIPSKEAIEFMIFIRLVLGEEPENTNPKAHYFLMDCIFQMDNVRPYFEARDIDFDELKGRTVVLCTREFGKSVMVVYFILYLAAKGVMPNFGPVRYGIYVSDSMRNNVETTMTTISKVYMESKYLRSIFEETRLIQTEVNFIRKPRSKKEIEVYNQHVLVEKQDPKTVPGRMKRTLTVTGLGAATGGRGSRDGLARPDFAIFDDLIPNEKDAESDTILENIESTIEADILKALSGNGNFAVMFGTPYKKNDPVYRRIEDGSWLPVVFPRAESMSLELKEEDFKSVWPDRHSFKQCKRDYVTAYRAKENGNAEPMRKLLQEYYLRISSEDDRMISDSMINWYDRDNLLQTLGYMNIYITTDFTTTGGHGSDFSGVACWAVSSNQDHFLLDLSLQKLEMAEQYAAVFRMVRKWGPYSRGVTVGVEIDGQQKAHLFSLKEQMIKTGTFFTFAKSKGAAFGAEGILSRSNGDKHWRFRMMLPVFQNKKIWFPQQLKDTPDMAEMMEELKYVTYSSFGSAHDDGIDLISQLGLMDITYPMQGQEMISGDSSGVKTRKRSSEDMWSIHDDTESSAYDSYA